ncbi:hypothetical protein SDC9_114482 [bioreactor metagenome]|uniref:Uncharacterized protein n=1 Tax=bioreactor metagenome TaxID=1076179 RepID=A0A645BQ51_9ZZZZ
MGKRQILNIINFVRAVEPRSEMDLVTPVAKHIALAKKYDLKATFLLQYDALINPEFTNIIKELDPHQFEVGVWFEVVQPLVEKASLTWHGRFPWDWHAHCGFSVGYTKKDREKLIDILFNDFREMMGYYPKSFGSWAFDAHTLAYVTEKYGIDSACNCKEQWGTDGYNLWGGYYGQGYYPNKLNAIAPAQSKDYQINTPVFRMLGADPIYQYDSGLNLTDGIQTQKVITLETVSNDRDAGGQFPKWVDWFLNENYNGKCLSFGYAQAGQENSFGWDGLAEALDYQYQRFAELQEQHLLDIETLGETGRWYKRTYAETPPSTITAECDWKNSGDSSVWFCCKNYRINIYSEDKHFWIRDLYVFRDDYEERYLKTVCKGNMLTYDNLPIIDGIRFSSGGIRSGLYPVLTGDEPNGGMAFEKMTYREKEHTAVLTFTGTACGTITITLDEKNVTIISGKPLSLIPCYAPVISKWIESAKADSILGKITLKYNSFDYAVEVAQGTLSENFEVSSQNNNIKIKLD